MSLLRRRTPAPLEAEVVEQTPDEQAPAFDGHQVGAHGYTAIALDYAVEPRARWGHGRPPHRVLAEILGRRRDRYRTELLGILEQREHFLAIPVEAGADASQPHWVNGWLPGLDSAALYTFLARGNPRTYLEVGSGNSTKFARRAIADHGLRTRLVSIDPSPRAEVDALCDEVVREPAESVNLGVFDRLEEGDILFVDNSHRCLQNSDATAMFLDVLPRLKPGVLVEFHDICLPDDYPPEWFERFYSEQYLLAAYLLAPGSRVDTVLPNHFVSRDPELCRVLDALWDDPRLPGVKHQGGSSFWLRTV
jgi:hypothetical protein